MKNRSSFLLLAVCGAMAGAVVAVACSDDNAATTTTELPADASPGKDAKTDTSPFEPPDASAEDAADAAIVDASDASLPPTVTGIWQGVQGDNYVVGPDAGVDSDAGFTDDCDGGKSTVIKRFVAHETDRHNCIDGDDYFSLFSDGTLRLEWRTKPADAVVGNLTRISTPGPAEPLVAVWSDPAIDVSGFRALLAVMTRTDTAGKGSGVFLLRDDNGGLACGGLWSLSQKTSASNLTLAESFPQGQVGCPFDGGVSAKLSVTDGGARYVRQIPADAGDAGELSLVKISP